jgi:hypothetical protein
MRRPAPRVLLGVGAATFLAVAAGAIVVTSGQGHEPHAASVIHAVGDAAEQQNVAAVSRLLTGLPAALAAGRTDALTPTAAARFRDVQAALPAGSAVSARPETWRHTGQVGSLEVTVHRPTVTQPASFVVVLMLEPDGWKVAATYPVDVP